MYQDLKIIGVGGEGTVYQEGDHALKIFKRRESEAISRRLVDIELQSIITPDEIITDASGEYLGYTMKYLDHAVSPKLITKHDLLESLKRIKEDLLKLGDLCILAHDLIPINSLYQDNELYIIDTSVYREGNCSVDSAIKINLGGLKRYIKGLVEESTGSLIGRKELAKRCYDYLPLIESEMSEFETMEEFSKRLLS